jgi:hypothetical protein
MHGFYIYKKVAACDPGRIQVFSHLAIRRIQEIFVQRQIRLTAGSQRAHYKTDARYRIAVIAWVFVHPECVCANGACDGSSGSSTRKEMAKFCYIPCALGHPASLYTFLHERLPCIRKISETEFWQLLGGLGPHSTGISVGDSVLGDNRARVSCFHFENPCEDKTTRSVLEDTNAKRQVRAFTKVRLLRHEVRAELLNLQWNLDYALVRPTLLI